MILVAAMAFCGLVGFIDRAAGLQAAAARAAAERVDHGHRRVAAAAERRPAEFRVRPQPAEDARRCCRIGKLASLTVRQRCQERDRDSRSACVDVAIFATAAVLMLALEYLVFRTKLGTAMRAVSFNTDIGLADGHPGRSRRVVHVCAGFGAGGGGRVSVRAEVSRAESAGPHDLGAAWG